MVELISLVIKLADIACPKCKSTEVFLEVDMDIVYLLCADCSMKQQARFIENK